MGKSKVKMPSDLKNKCHKVIHTATAAAVAAGAMPIPMSDAIPITTAQVLMIVQLGKIFGVSLSESSAKSLIAGKLGQTAGRTIATNIIKMIPGGGTIVGGIISASTAGVITEGIGWIVADDFYRMSQGQEPEDIVGVSERLKELFLDVRVHTK